MDDDSEDASPGDLTADEESLLDEMPSSADAGLTRRTFLGSLGRRRPRAARAGEGICRPPTGAGRGHGASCGREPRPGRPEGQRRVEAAGARLARRAARCLARAARADRLEEGVRPGAVRGLHRPRRRPSRAVLPDARGERRGREVTTIEGLAQRRPASTPCRRPSSSTTPSSAATARPGRSARRSGCSRRRAAARPVTSPRTSLRATTTADGRRDPRAHEREHLPMRRLSRRSSPPCRRFTPAARRGTPGGSSASRSWRACAKEDGHEAV